MIDETTLVKINDVTTTEFTKELDLPDGADSVTIQSVVNSLTGTSIQANIQHSLDSTNWHDVSGADAGAQTGTGSALARSTGNAALGKLRLRVQKTAITVLDVDIWIQVHHH